MYQNIFINEFDKEFLLRHTLIIQEYSQHHSLDRLHGQPYEKAVSVYMALNALQNSILSLN